MQTLNPAARAAQVCNVTCCGRANFEQHCACKKHKRKVEAAAAGSAGGGGRELVGAAESDRDRGVTYVGLQAQCGSYCKQVCPP